MFVFCTNRNIVGLLFPHAQDILDLVRRSFEEENRPETVSRLGYGLMGDLAETFQGQIKNILLSEWIAAELKARHRYPSETKKTMRWAREVCLLLLYLRRYTQHARR